MDEIVYARLRALEKIVYGFGLAIAAVVFGFLFWVFWR